LRYKDIDGSTSLQAKKIAINGALFFAIYCYAVIR